MTPDRKTISIVTGAASGIGRAIALRLGQESGPVIIADIDADGGMETSRQIESSGGTAEFIRTDVAHEDDVRTLFQHVERTHGRVDVLVNNAGIAPGPNFPEADSSHWQRTLDVNLRGVMLCIQYGIGVMKKSGGGSIVNVSSMAAIGFQAYSAPEYSASKAAIVRLTSSLTNLHDSWNVRVNCICPGWVATQAVKRKLSEMTEEEKAAESFPPPRVLIRPEEIADKVWMFITNNDMAGRVMIWPDGDSPKLIDVDSEL